MARKNAVPKEFQTGDIVLVESSGRGLRSSPKWRNTWADEMEATVGKCFKVKHENQGQGVWLNPYPDNDDKTVYGYPEKTLRLIKRGKIGYFRKGEKVFVASHPENTSPHWHTGGDMKVGAVLTVVSEYGANSNYKLSDDYFYGCDCLELYTGQVPDDREPTKVLRFAINEPLQPWERF